MVCGKCQKKLKKTELATPGVKRKNDMYYGSPSSTLGGGGDAKSKPTLGNTGISKVSWFAIIDGGGFFFLMASMVIDILVLIFLSFCDNMDFASDEEEEKLDILIIIDFENLPSHFI